MRVVVFDVDNTLLKCDSLLIAAKLANNPIQLFVGIIKIIPFYFLWKTGFLEVFADFMYTHVGKNKWVTIATFLLIVSILSGLINNTAAVAIFIPLAINLCQKFHISPTRVLLAKTFCT